LNETLKKSVLEFERVGWEPPSLRREVEGVCRRKERSRDPAGGERPTWNQDSRATR
jgi:hypothetical protein